MTRYELAILCGFLAAFQSCACAPDYAVEAVAIQGNASSDNDCVTASVLLERAENMRATASVVTRLNMCADSLQREFTLTLDAHQVTVLASLRFELINEARWKIIRLEVRGLAPGLELSLLIPTLRADGSQLQLMLNGAPFELARDAVEARVELARDEATEIGIRTEERLEVKTKAAELSR